MILVTGATGLVGSHLLLSLASGEEKVVALKRKTSDLSCVINVFSAHPELYNNIQWVEGDILDYSSLKKAMNGIIKVYDCAGIISFDPADSDLMMKINIEGTANVVNVCIDNQIDKLCYVSSVSAINRINENEIIDENTEWKTSKENSKYAISKYEAEHIVRRGMTKGLKTVIVNPTIIIGSGNWKTGSTTMFQQVWRGLKFYTNGIAGFVDVRDVCEAMIRLMDSDIHSERFIVNGDNLPYKKIFDWIADNLGKPKPSIEANPLMLSIAWRIAALKKYLFKSKPFVTRETIVSGTKKLNFSNSKIKKAIDIKFIPIQQSVKETCAVFLKDQLQKELSK